MVTDIEAALIISKRLQDSGYEVVNIKNIEADIKAIRERKLRDKEAIQAMQGWRRKKGNKMRTYQKWIIGNSIDCLLKLPNGSVDLLVTDPPYNIGFDYKGGYKDNITDDEYIELLSSFQRIPAVFIHYPEETIKYLVPALGIPKKIVSWVYNSNTNRQHRLISWFNCEPDFSRIKQPYKNLNDKRIKELIANGSTGTKLYDWWFINQVKNVSKEKTNHPCQIPLEIYERIIVLTTNEGDTVLDPFLGSGTALEACRNTNRNCIGIEIDSQWEPIYRKRLKLDEIKLDV